MVAAVLQSSVSSPIKPLVSVVITAYNVEPFIVKSIESALGQTYSNLEIIVVDDGSKDGTDKAVEQFGDPRVRLIRKENGGCASARNAGVEVSRGDFISFLDGDDFWLPNKIERELKCIESHPHADLVFSLSLIVDEQGESLGILKFNTQRSFSFEDLLVENPVGNGSAVLIKKETLDQVGLFDESLPASSDTDMWLRIAKLKNENFICLPQIFTCYRRRSSQTTSDYRRMEKSYELILAKARLIAPNVSRGLERRSRFNANRYHAYIAYEEGDLKAARWQLLRSFMSAPVSFLLTTRSWLLALGMASKSFLPNSMHSKLVAVFLSLRSRHSAARV